MKAGSDENKYVLIVKDDLFAYVFLGPTSEADTKTT